MIFTECDSPTVEWYIFCVEDLSTLLNHLLLIFIWMLRKGAKILPLHVCPFPEYPGLQVQL